MSDANPFTLSDHVQGVGHEIRRTETEGFATEVEALVKDAEVRRLNFMRERQNRGFISLIIGLISLVIGASAFGWFFLMQGDILKAVGCVFLSVLPPLLTHKWRDKPIAAYARDHKVNFMPKMAKLLGGFQYHPAGGVGEKVIAMTGIAPQHSRYDAEDCFTGRYKGLKVIFSEARLYQGNKPVFQGLFVLIEAPGKIFEGHTIMTANKKMAESWGPTRWNKLTPVPVKTVNPDWARFHIFSDRPDEAERVANDKLLKELSEAADIFNKSAITVALFGKHNIFIMIPNKEDMFEASSLLEPIPSRENALERRREVEKLLEIIDVFEIYKTVDPASTSPAVPEGPPAATAPVTPPVTSGPSAV